MLAYHHRLPESQGPEEAYRAYTALVNRFLLVLAAVGLLAWALAPSLARLRIPGFTSADIALAAEMFRWVLPLVVIQVAAEVFKTLANAERLFGAPEAASLMARLLALATLALLARPLGAWALIVSLWCAGVVETLAILWLLRRRRYCYRPSLALPDGARGVGMFGATLPYVALTQVLAFVFDAALSHLPQGSFAVFRYATMIWSRTQGIFLRPLSIPFFTNFSESTARNLPATATLIESALTRVLAVTAIVTTAVVVGAGRVLSALWGGEKFPPDQIATLVWLLAGLYALLPIVGAAAILRKASVSVHRIRETYLGIAVVQVISTVLVYVLVEPVGLWGALVVSTLNQVGFYLASLVAIRRGGDSFRFVLPYGRAWRWLVAVSIGVATGLALDQGLAQLGFGGDLARPVGFLVGCLVAATGVGVCLVGALLLRVPESHQLVAAVQRTLRKALRG